MPQATHTPHVPRDILYHLGYPLPESTADLTARLRAVQYVLLCGTASRARSLAAAVAPGPHDDICRTDRYTVLVPAPHVVVAAHGIGTGSVDCLLHELVKALRVAGAEGYAFIRVGSCGGVGIAPGGVVVSGAVLNGVFAPVLNMCVLGKVVEMPAVLDASLRAKLLEFGKGLFGDGAVVQGDTMSAETFYTAQGRLDGAFCDFGRTERAAFLEKCRSRGIRNFEMEGLALAAFAKRAGIPAAVVCVVLVDRTKNETPLESERALKSYEARPVQLVTAFIQHQHQIRTLANGSNGQRLE